MRSRAGHPPRWAAFEAFSRTICECLFDATPILTLDDVKTVDVSVKAFGRYLAADVDTSASKSPPSPAGEAMGSRGKTEARLAAAERVYGWACQGCVKDFISKDEATMPTPAFRAEREGARDELASCEVVITVQRLRPFDVATYLDAVDQLDGAHERIKADGGTESSAAFHAPVEPTAV